MALEETNATVMLGSSKLLSKLKTFLYNSGIFPWKEQTFQLGRFSSSIICITWRIISEKEPLEFHIDRVFRPLHITDQQAVAMATGSRHMPACRHYACVVWTENIWTFNREIFLIFKNREFNQTHFRYHIKYVRRWRSAPTIR